MPDGAVPRAAPGTRQAPPEVVPPLRQDIEIHPGSRNRDGSPSYVLRDPAAESYVNIGAREIEILSRWWHGTTDAIAQATSNETTFRVVAAEVAMMSESLLRQGLLQADAKSIAQRRRAAGAGGGGSFARSVSSALFPRLPLFSPARLIDRLLPFAAPFFQPWLWLGAIVVLLAAGLLILRELPRFLASLTAMFTPEGAIATFVALVAGKLLHELGHGIAARRYGADVPVLGLSFVLLCPLVYVETSAAWTVRSRRQRIVIAAAGMAAEALLAVAALAIWPFLDAGPLRDAAGFCGTTVFALSIAFNANPLMRFDGYYILGEILAVDNLQPRSLALLRWRARTWLAGTNEPSPEPGMLGSIRRSMLVYGAASLAWRGLIYVGMAWGLMAALPSVLAVPLSALVLATFLGLPALRGVATIAKLALRQADWRGRLRMLVVAAPMLALLLVPWRSTISVPIVLDGAEVHDVFAPEPARLCGLEGSDGTIVEAGRVLARLCVPDLEFDIAKARIRARALEGVIDRHSTEQSYHAAVPVRFEELQRVKAEIVGLEARLAKLVLTAPAAGRLVIPDRGMVPGRWVRTDQPILRIVRDGIAKADAYVDERDLGHVAPGAGVAMWLDGMPLASIPAVVESVHQEALAVLDEPSLAASSGGPIAVRQAAGGALAPELALYKVRLRPSSGPDGTTGDGWARLPHVRLRGYARIETPPRNLVQRIAQRAIGFWRRELG